MEQSPFFLYTLSFLLLLGIACIVQLFMQKIRQPASLGLLLTGIILSLLHTTPIGQYFVLEFSPELLLYIFLPTLIFESASSLKLRTLRSLLPEILSLATVGLVLFILIMGVTLHYVVGFRWALSFLFASIIAPTDPTAVVGVLKRISLPQKLRTLIEGESLVNDGTSVVVFQILLGVIVAAELHFTPGFFLVQAEHTFRHIFGALAVGGVMGGAFLLALRNTHYRPVQLAISFLLAHSTFLIAEGIFHVSGIIATLTAGLILGNLIGGRMEEKSAEIFHEVWNFLGFLSHAMIFLLLGMKIGTLDFLPYWKEILVTSLLVIFFGRPLSVLLNLWVTNLFRPAAQKISLTHQGIIIWGGLRGALSAAMVLLVPSTLPYADLLVVLVTGCIMLTFLINATTLETVMKKVHERQRGFSDSVREMETDILVDEQLRLELKELSEKSLLSPPVYAAMEKRYAKHERSTAKRLAEIQNQLSGEETREIEKMLNYHVLMIELQEYHKLFQLKEISEKRLQVLQESIWRQVDRLELDILPEEHEKIGGKTAPHIPKQCRWQQSTLFGLPYKWWRRKRQKQILERLDHYRARALSGRAVIQQLQHMHQMKELQCEWPMIDRIIARYVAWVANAEEKAEALRTEYPELLFEAEMQVAEHYCCLRGQELRDEISAMRHA
ncbi:cation:proton antiporter [Candidatus Peribacteria bacterium]|nr:cation:proton antiporter [Candidatus Peribacteria bacterium]